jgi:hypothetical protein
MPDELRAPPPVDASVSRGGEEAVNMAGGA